MAFIDKNGRQIGSDYEYEYTGKIGLDSKKYSRASIVLGYIVGFVVVLLGVFLLCQSYFLNITDYIWGGICFILFGGYIFYNVRKSVKKRKEIEEALRGFEMSKTGCDTNSNLDQ